MLTYRSILRLHPKIDRVLSLVSILLQLSHPILHVSLLSFHQQSLKLLIWGLISLEEMTISRLASSILPCCSQHHFMSNWLCATKHRILLPIETTAILSNSFLAHKHPLQCAWWPDNMCPFCLCKSSTPLRLSFSELFACEQVYPLMAWTWACLGEGITESRGPLGCMPHCCMCSGFAIHLNMWGKISTQCLSGFSTCLFTINLHLAVKVCSKSNRYYCTWDIIHVFIFSNLILFSLKLTKTN